jgi:hypothetical protein
MIDCIRYKPVNKGSLLGFADIAVEGLPLVHIYGCGVFQKEGRRWVTMPSREWIDEETGLKKFYAYIRLAEPGSMYQFSHDAMHCVLPHIDPHMIL